MLIDAHSVSSFCWYTPSRGRRRRLMSMFGLGGVYSTRPFCSLVMILRRFDAALSRASTLPCLIGLESALLPTGTPLSFPSTSTPLVSQSTPLVCSHGATSRLGVVAIRRLNRRRPHLLGLGFLLPLVVTPFVTVCVTAVGVDAPPLPSIFVPTCVKTSPVSP